MELARYFGIDDCLLSPTTADSVWERTQAYFDAGLSARQLMRQSKVRVVCTTDDPVDSLEHHIAVAREDFGVKMFPAFRPDAVLFPENGGYRDYIERLAAASDVAIDSYATLIEALRQRHDYFHAQGCRLSDHGMIRAYYAEASDAAIGRIFAKALAGTALDAVEDEQFKTALLLEFGRMDAEKGWTKQLHLGALRSANTRMLRQVGRDSGFDSIHDHNYAEKLARYLDALDREEQLPKTILYTEVRSLKIV